MLGWQLAPLLLSCPIRSSHVVPPVRHEHKNVRIPEPCIELAGDFEKDEKRTGPFRIRGSAKYPAKNRMVPTSQKPTV